MQTQAESDQLNRRLAANFIAREFICPCCNKEGVKDNLVFHLHAEIGGVEDSSHPNGTGVDIKCESPRERFLLLKALFTVGFKRIGIYKKHIHADLDPNKDQEVAW